MAKYLDMTGLTYLISKIIALINAKSDKNHTHNYAGSSSAGGAATTALTCTGNSATATVADKAKNANSATFIIPSNGTSNAEGGELQLTNQDNTVWHIDSCANNLRIFDSAGNVHFNCIDDSVSNSRFYGTSTNADTLDNYHASSFVLSSNFLAGNLGSKAIYYSVETNKDCNDIEEFLALAGGVDGLHYPTSNTYYYILTLKYSSSAKKQLAFGYKGTATNNILFRTWIDNAWSEWKQLYTSQNITYGTSALTPGSSSLTTGAIYLQYE